MKDRMVREEMTELNWPESPKDIAKASTETDRRIIADDYPSATLLIIDVMLEHLALETILVLVRLHK